MPMRLAESEVSTWALAGQMSHNTAGVRVHLTVLENRQTVRVQLVSQTQAQQQPVRTPITVTSELAHIMAYHVASGHSSLSDSCYWMGCP